jgi:hypothetical protein
MTEERPLTMDEIMDLIEPEFERQVDAMILQQPDIEARMMMMRHRGRILDKMRDVTRIANLQARVGELEDRLRPRLVEG